VGRKGVERRWGRVEGGLGGELVKVKVEGGETYGGRTREKGGRRG